MTIGCTPEGVPPTNASTSDGPLTEAHQHELARARERSTTVRKAARVASFNGWVTAIIAAFSALFTILFFSMVGLLVTLGLALVAYNEFRGRKRLLAFDPSGATLLGRNQLGLLTLILVYCVWALYSGLYGANTVEAQLRANPDLSSAIGSVEGFDALYRLIVVALYGSVIVLSILFQGANAIYYFTRRRHVERYLRETPEWVVKLQRATTP